MHDLLTQLASLLGILSALVAPASEPVTDQAAESGATTTAHVVRVIDGDTIDVMRGRTTERVRYIGIDAPEVAHDGSQSECYADAASALNETLVGNQQVQLVSGVEDRDTYGRLLRYVYVDDTFVNEELVAHGAATTLPIPPNTDRWRLFAAAKQTAQDTDRGLWGACE